MESWKASMTPTIESFFEGNGFGVIASSDPSPRTLSSFTTSTIVIAASKVKHLYSLSKNKDTLLLFHLQSSHCLKLITFPMVPSLSSASYEAIRILISLESTLSFLKSSFILMFGLKSSPICTRFNSISVTNWLPLSSTVYQDGSLQILEIGNLCADTC